MWWTWMDGRRKTPSKTSYRLLPQGPTLKIRRVLNIWMR